MNYFEQIREEVYSWVRRGNDNPYEAVLLRASGDNTAWMEEYGLPVLPQERQLAEFLFAYDAEQLALMGNRIVDAFLHGFISQSRDRAGRTLVRFSYQLGQEAIAREVYFALVQKGLEPSVQKPGCLTCEKTDRTVYNMADCLEKCAAYEAAFQQYDAQMRNTCGMIGIIQFGEAPPEPGETQGTRQQRELTAKLNGYKRGLESERIPPATISFCKVAFPNLFAGERFEEIFQDVFQMNLQNSEPYERMQQTVIDALDLCAEIRVVGRGENRTDLTIRLLELRDSSKQSNFLNCGGDLNIPYGEVFTTPVLEGTNGLLHVREVYLSGIPYRELELTFRDGYLVRADSADGAAYVKRNLLNPHDTLTAGEFAIGTNTSAYAIALRYGLLPRIPILWLEKMGPHLAIGDPCFARGEDACVFNLYDGKEMTARENERTARRDKDREVYYNKHVDITIPFQDIGALYGVAQNGERHMIVKDGRFVLSGTEGLNEGLEEPA
ncbi:MAG: aminopeptidase [Eubacteriales bacterium]